MRNIYSLSEKLGDVYEELRRRMVDVCCLEEVRCSRHGSRTLEIEGIEIERYKLWWSGKGD